MERMGRMSEQATKKLSAFVELARPLQWSKNGLLFAGYIFAGRLKAPMPSAAIELFAVVLAFLSFCLLSSFAYAINDLRDRERDSHHPLKRHRPLPSGRIKSHEAILFAILCLLFGLSLSVAVSAIMHTPTFILAAVSYPVWAISYSVLMKDIVIVDVLAVAAGFVLRVAAGCIAIGVSISPWLLLCTLLLSLFIALCKRRHELLLLGDRAHGFRNVLPKYSPGMLDQMIAATAAATIMAYSLYTFTAPHILLGNSNSPWLMLTIPYVIYGMFRYMYLAYSTDVAGEPEKMLQDVPLLLTILLWILTVIALSFISGR
ncbi:MAG: decaprenyl-phosphate phosphoribosyltransferase [Armatimonadota bacterium]|nr:decaprenyl-phosphate phosphoribosyltransferase [Armatimonadota bacterium]MDW8026202.1 decaprenyl-phosphate phosphoribosyltransferase [Armatimonadota bacterium]